MSLSAYRSSIYDRLLLFLWRQWAQLGVQASGLKLENNRDGWIIDPEALWLFSSNLARHDARLFDEVMDWLIVNASFISISRLKSIAHNLALGDPHVMAAMTDTISRHNPRVTWKMKLSVPSKGPEPLFYAKDGQPMADYAIPDAIFLQRGLKRGHVELRQMSRTFNKVMPECALLRLRALFGVTARAEIMLYLLTHEVGHPSGIAREIGYSQKNVHDTLVDLTASGYVFAGELEGRKRSYFMTDKTRAKLLHNPKKPPIWITWPALFRALETLTQWLDQRANAEMSEDLLASELQRVEKEMRPFLRMANYDKVFSQDIASETAATKERFEQAIEKLLNALHV